MKIIGHRGYSAKYPENTLMAFQAAMDAGADMIEFDVLLSKDMIPVIIHDETLNRTTNGKGKVSDFSLNELKKLNAGQDQTIPTLEEVLALTKGKISLHVEIKTEAVSEKIVNGVEEQTLGLLEKYGFSSSCIVSSFNSIPLFRLRSMKNNLAVAITLDHSIKEADKTLIEKLKPSAIHLPINHLNNEDVDFASVQNLPISVYTVNSTMQMKKAQDMCVDGIFTNEVEKAITYFTAHHPIG